MSLLKQKGEQAQSDIKSLLPTTKALQNCLSTANNNIQDLKKLVKELEKKVTKK